MFHKDLLVQLSKINNLEPDSLIKILLKLVSAIYIYITSFEHSNRGWFVTPTKTKRYIDFTYINLHNKQLLHTLVANNTKTRVIISLNHDEIHKLKFIDPNIMN